MRLACYIGLFIVSIINCYADDEVSGSHLSEPSFLPTEGMQSILHTESILHAKTDRQKIDAILSEIFAFENGRFVYQPKVTIPPFEALQQRRGNCLTFAMLFITLARASGLDAKFNEVDVSPSWVREGAVVVETGHINVVVHSRSQTYVVEWLDHYKEISSRFVSPIDDNRARSHYFNNLGVIALSESKLPQSKLLIQKALKLDQKNGDAWQNYGVYWVHKGDLEQAEQAFLSGIKVKKKGSSIHFLLSKLYENKGDPEKSAFYLKKGKRYANKNPFYHYTLAMINKENGNLQRSIKHLKNAIKRLPDYHLFHNRIAQMYLEQGDMDLWNKHMVKAISSTSSIETKTRYRYEIKKRHGAAESMPAIVN